MIKLFLTFFCLIIFLFTAVSAQNKHTTDSTQSGKLLAKIEALHPALEKILTNQEVAGFAIAVVGPDGLVYSKGFGYRDLEQKKPVTTNTLFAIGSSSKAFTAALMGKLADQDKISLDKPVINYLPSLRFSTDELNSKVTLRDMMTHRTGIARYDVSWYAFVTPSRDSLLKRVQYMKPNVGLREKWQYNNFMFLAQGMVAEHFWGKSWEEIIRQEFFEPLGMRRSNTSIAALEQDPDASLGYTIVRDSVFKKLPYYHIGAMGPAGSINSSVNELSNWVRLWLNGGKFNDKEIFSTTYALDALSSQMVMSGGRPAVHPDISFSTYGLGWMLSSYRGHYMAEHGGNIDGFSANVALFPSDKLGIIVLTNKNASSAPDLVRNILADGIFNLTPYDWNKPRKKIAKDTINKKEEDIVKIVGTHPSHPLEDYTGIAEHPAFGKMKIYLKGDSLYVNISNDSLYLRHYHYDVFEGMMIDKKTGKVDSTENMLKFNFQSNEDGAISSVSLMLESSEGGPQSFKFKRNAQLSVTELEKYTGAYKMGNADVRVYVKSQSLYIAVPGQPDYKTTYAEDHKFKPDVLPGFTFRFELDKQGKVLALYSVQPNGTFKLEKKQKPDH